MSMVINPFAVTPGGLPVVTTTWNPSDKGAGISLSGGDLTATHSGVGTTYLVRGNNSRGTSGKLYLEFVIDSAPNLSSARGRPDVGIANTVYPTNGEHLGVGTGDANGLGVQHTNGVGSNFDGKVGAFATYISGGPSWGVSDVIGMAIDFGAGLIWFAVNGTFTGNPAAGTGYPDWTGPISYSPPFFSGSFFPAMSCAFGGAVTLRCKLAAFSYTPPTGFSSWDGD